LLLAVRPSLHLGESVTRCGIDGAECHHVLAPHAGDRSDQKRFHPRALGDFAPDARSDALLWRFAHHGQRLARPFVRDDVQEGRLLQVDSQRFLERPVENRIAGGIDEIREQN